MWVVNRYSLSHDNRSGQDCACKFTPAFSASDTLYQVTTAQIISASDYIFGKPYQVHYRDHSPAPSLARLEKPHTSDAVGLTVAYSRSAGYECPHSRPFGSGAHRATGVAAFTHKPCKGRANTAKPLKSLRKSGAYINLLYQDGILSAWIGWKV